MTRDEVTVRWKKNYIMINFIILHSSLINIRMIKPQRIRWTGYVAGMGGKPEGQRPFGRYRFTWEHNFKVNFK
jgi:hypothetical protein